MKKTVSKLIALLMVAMMLVAAVPFASLAEAPATGVNVSLEFDHINDGHYDFYFTITIPKGYNASSITLDDFMDMAAGEMWYNPTKKNQETNEDEYILDENGERVREDIHVMPGDETIYHFTLVNNSDIEYAYLKESASLGLVEPYFLIRRLPNTVLTGSVENGGLGLTESDAGLSNANVAAALRNAGFGTADESDDDVVNNYLDDFYLSYYNSKNANDQVDSFDKLPSSFVSEMMKTKLKAYNVRESNSIVSQGFGVRYFKESIYYVNATYQSGGMPVGGNVLADIEDKTTTAYASFDKLFEDGIKTNNLSFQTMLSGPAMGNQYQGWSYAEKLSFTLVKAVSKISEPGSEKFIVVGDEELSHDDIAAGEDVNFILKSNIGEDFTVVFPEDYPVAGEDPNAYGYTRANFGEYTFKFVDKYDPAFIIPDDASGYVVKVNGTQLTTDQYTFTMATAEDGTRTFEIAINDLVQLFLDGVFNYEDIGVAPITVEYTAQTSEDLTAGTYVNESWVEYNGTPTEHSTVDVSTYKITVFKFDQATHAPLAGATFALYDVDPTAEGNENVEPIATGVTNADGEVIFDGLDLGTYYLVETQAPDGYVCDSSVHTINIVAGETGYAVNEYVEFPNVSVPHTGGEGTKMFYTVGGAILVCAAAAYVVSRKKAGSLA